MTKTESAQLACEKVLNGIEDDTITTTSALLQCLKIARLLNDVDAIIWLQYEYGGYPKDKDGVHIPTEVWNVGYKMDEDSLIKRENAFLRNLHLN